jgi:hypothetical protein
LPRPSTLPAPSAVVSAASSAAPPIEAVEETALAEVPSTATRHYVTRVIVGEGWGCAELDVHDDIAHQYCWRVPKGRDQSRSGTQSGVSVLAKRVPWLVVSAVASGDRLCARDGRQIKCWPALEFIDAAPSDIPERKSWRAQGKDTRFAIGIFASNRFECVLNERALECQGSDEFGQLAPGHLPKNLETMSWHSVALGRFHACSSLDFDVDCWGRGDHGELGAAARSTCRGGNRDIACSRVPVRVKGPEHTLKGVPLLFAGDLFTCAMWDGFVECWGASRDGFFGTAAACPAALKQAWPTAKGTAPAPRAACSTTPVRVAGLRFHHARSWSAGPRGICVDDDDDTSSCVGGIKAPRGASPVIVSSGDEPSACAITPEGVQCWGAGYSPSNQPNQPISIEFEPRPPISAAPAIDSKGLWDRNCMIHTPCARDVEAIPKCGPSITAQAWAKLAPRADEHRGQSIAVQGTLVTGKGGQTLMGCSRTGPGDPVDPDPSQVCCNGSFSTIVLAGGETPLLIEGLDCRGDESRRCCNVAPLGQPVIASGGLDWSDEMGGPGWILRQPTLCLK